MEEIIAQIAERLKIKPEELVAVIFYSNPQWDEVVVYGDKTVADTVQVDCSWATVTHHELDELDFVPDSNLNCASGMYGVKKGRIQLVLGLPE